MTRCRKSFVTIPNHFDLENFVGKCIYYKANPDKLLKLDLQHIMSKLVRIYL